jgi:hypothetical protein
MTRKIYSFSPNPVVIEAVIGVKRDNHHPYHWTADCDFIGVIAPPALEGCGDGSDGRGATRSDAILDCLRRTLDEADEVGARFVDDLQTFEPKVTLVIHINDVTPCAALITEAERALLGPEPTRAEAEAAQPE